MKIFIGADHRGYRLKTGICRYLKTLGHKSVDLGAYTDAAPCDYPEIAFDLARNVAASRNARGILICMSGIGQAIAANKIPGAYAALCYNKKAAVLSRRHNNANILVLGAGFVGAAGIKGIIRAWMETSFEGGRHLRRVRKIQVEEKLLYRKIP